MSLMDL